MMKGFQLGTYVLEEKLGEGGMAEVWRARNPLLNTYAAVKFLVPKLAGNPDIEKRFLGEGKRQAALQHPNIVSAFDFHYIDNRSYLVMKYVHGESLEQRLFNLQIPMSLAEAAAISRDVLSALEYAHSQGVVHRDIKPSNLLIENGGRVQVLDFGIALALGEERLTRIGAAIGTPHYMSPEQIVGARTIDGRSDIYSFGCVLYQMLTQVTPFDATEEDGDVEYIVKDKHLHELPVPPSQLNPAIPDYVENVILRCLAKKQAERYDTCAEVLAALTGPQYAPPFPTRKPTVVEDFHRTAVPLTSRTAAPSTAPPTVFTQPPAARVAAPTAAPSSPASASRRGPLWVGIGVAAALVLSGGGYFALHRENVSTPVAKERKAPEKPVEKTDITPPKKLQLAPKVIPPETDGSNPAPGAGRGGADASRDPGAGTITNPPPPPPVLKTAIVPVDQLLSDGKMQLTDHDDAAARESFRKASDAGNAQAMVLLGTMYEQGLGGPKNDADAISMFQQASELGYASGTYNLGTMYDGGRGVPANQARAATLYEKATEQKGGNPNAALRLGQMYQLGQGVPKDIGKARKYYELSGTPEARAALAKLPPQ